MNFLTDLTVKDFLKIHIETRGKNVTKPKTIIKADKNRYPYIKNN